MVHIQQLCCLSLAIVQSTTIVLPAWRRHCEAHKIKPHVLPCDVVTHWNSTFDMLNFAVQYQAVIDTMTVDNSLKLQKFELETGVDYCRRPHNSLTCEYLYISSAIYYSLSSVAVQECNTLFLPGHHQRRCHHSHLDHITHCLNQWTGMTFRHTTLPSLWPWSWWVRRWTATTHSLTPCLYTKSPWSYTWVWSLNTFAITIGRPSGLRKQTGLFEPSMSYNMSNKLMKPPQCHWRVQSLTIIVDLHHSVTFQLPQFPAQVRSRNTSAILLRMSRIHWNGGWTTKKSIQGFIKSHWTI